MTDTDARPQRARGSRRREGEGGGWYRITNLADGAAQILIYDEIGFWGVTAQDFIRDLAAVNGPVEVRVNSPGGDVFDAYAIYNALASRPGVTMIVDSLAASAASVIVMAGERRLMAKTSQMMIHDAWAMSDGNAGDLRHMADRLDTVSGQIAGVYASVAGGDPESWREAMRAETWYTPEQALAAGLITGISEPARSAPALEPAGASAGDPGIRAAAQGGPQDATARHEPVAGSRDHTHGGAMPGDTAAGDVRADGVDEPAAAPAVAAATPEGSQEPPAAIGANAPPAPPAAQPAAPIPASSRPGARPDPSAHARQEGSTVTTMSIEDRAARRGEIEARLTEIGTGHGDAEFPQEIQAEWDTLTGELDEHEQVLARHEQGLAARRERLAAIAARQTGERVNGEEAGFTAPGEGEGAAPHRGAVWARVPDAPGLVRGRTDMSIYDVDDIRKRSRSQPEMAALCRDNALRAIERATFPGSESREKAQTTVERLLARVDGEDAVLARRILVTGNPLYMQAWGKAVARLSTAVLAPDEIRALSVGTGSDGGFAVPFELDPTLLLTSNGAINPLRQISRVQTITGKEYDLVTSAGVTVTRSAEASAVPNNNPVLAQPTIKAERVTGFVPFSVEIEQDWAALQSEMMMLLTDAKDVEESSSFTNGNGVSPNAGGIIATLASGSLVNGTGGSGALAVGDLDALENTVPPRFRARASWMASKTIYNAYRALMTAVASAAGDQWVRPTLAAPAELRGYPAYEDSDMVATHATNDKVIILGDFSRGFIIVERLGMAVEMVPHLFDQATARPTGQRGILAIWRTNSRVIIDNAFRLIKVT